MKYILSTLLFTGFSFLMLQAGGPEKYKKKVTVAFYNVENLFDTEDDPTINDNEFLPEGSYKWTEENLQVKLQNLARVISQLGDDDGPEILGLAEVENRGVIEMLVKSSALKKRGYQIIHHDSPDQRGIDVALIYKKKTFLPLYFKAYPVPFPENPDMKPAIYCWSKAFWTRKWKSLLCQPLSSRRGARPNS